LPGTDELEATVELTARGRRALAEFHGLTGGTSLTRQVPATPSRTRTPRHGLSGGSITIVGDSTEGETSLICGIDTLPLETPGMGGIYYCIYCGQTFHEICIMEYMRYSKKCPNPMCPSQELGVSFEVKELK